MKNTSRREFLKYVGAGAAAAALPSYAQAQTRPTRTARLDQPVNQQSLWVLEELAKKHGSAEKIPDIVILDKHNATATAYKAGQPVLTIPVLLGESGNDTFSQDESAFAQKTTPAGAFKNIEIIFSPRVNPQNYRKQMLIAFDTYTRYMPESNIWESLTFHSILDPDKDGPLLAERNPRKKQISNGCVRMSYEHFDALLLFCIGEDAQKREWLNVAAKRKGVDTDAPPLQFMPCKQVSVLILPQLNRTRAHTLQMVGLDTPPAPQSVPAAPKP